MEFRVQGLEFQESSTKYQVSRIQKIVKILTTKNYEKDFNLIVNDNDFCFFGRSKKNKGADC